MLEIATERLVLRPLEIEGNVPRCGSGYDSHVMPASAEARA